MQPNIHLGMKALCGKNMDKYDNKISNKQFLLGKYFTPKKYRCPKPFPKTKFAKMLKKQLQFIPESIENKYELYLPLHELWLKYTGEILDQEKDKQSRELKLLRSDFHGALIEVVASRNQTQVGIKGIVIGQTLKTFNIITQQQERKTILKHICVFLVRTTQQGFIVNGAGIAYRPSERIRHKFKFKQADVLQYSSLALLNQEQ